MRILVVENNSAISDEVEYYLSSEGFLCDISRNIIDAQEMAQAGEYNLVFLNADLDQTPDFEVLQALRTAKTEKPMILLYDFDDPYARARGLRAGADDCIVCPFDEQEFVARVHALLRRAQQWEPTVIEIDMSKSTSEPHIIYACLDIGKTFDAYEGGWWNYHSPKACTEILESKEFEVEYLQFLNFVYSHASTNWRRSCPWTFEQDRIDVEIFVQKLNTRIAAKTGCEAYIKMVPGKGFILNNQTDRP